MLNSRIPCGCRHCGCLCEAHAAPAMPRRCMVHAVLVAMAHEAGTLVSLALFGGMIAVWAAVLGHL